MPLAPPAPSCSTWTARSPIRRPTWPAPSTACAASAASNRRRLTAAPACLVRRARLARRRFRPAARRVDYEALRVAFLESYEANLALESRLFDGIAGTAGPLAGSAALGHGHQQGGPLHHALLPQIGLRRAGCVICGDTTPHSKPHPEPLLEAARRLSLAPQTACT